jgi:hypothetical protein
MWRWCCAFLCLAAAACGGNEYGGRRLYPVSGRILVNGQPANQALVTLFETNEAPLDATGGVIRPQGWTDADGRFTLTSSPHTMNDGAPAGEYRVTVTWPAHRSGFGMGPDKLGGKYAKAETSGLTVRIDEKKNALAPLELSVDPEQIEAATQAGNTKPGRSKGKH